MKEGIGMLFKKKTLDEKMEKYVKHHDCMQYRKRLQEAKKGRLQQPRHLGQAMTRAV